MKKLLWHIFIRSELCSKKNAISNHMIKGYSSALKNNNNKRISKEGPIDFAASWTLSFSIIDIVTDQDLEQYII